MEGSAHKVLESVENLHQPQKSLYAKMQHGKILSQLSWTQAELIMVL